MKLANECRYDVRIIEIKIVMRPIEIAGHDGNILAPVLPAVGLAGHNSGDFGDRIPLVSRFERSRQQRRFLNGLGGKFWVDAGRAQENKTVDASLVRPVNDIGLNGEIVIDEVGRIGTIGDNAADFRGGEDNCSGLIGAQPKFNIHLAPKVEDGAVDCNDLAPLTCEEARNGGSDHAAVAGDPNPFFHF